MTEHGRVQKSSVDTSTREFFWVSYNVEIKVAPEAQVIQQTIKLPSGRHNERLIIRYGDHDIAQISRFGTNRITEQMSMPKYKVSASVGVQRNCQCNWFCRLLHGRLRPVQLA